MNGEDSRRETFDTSNLLAEAIPIGKLLAVWSLIAAGPLLYAVFVDSSSPIGIVSRFLGEFVLFLGGANALLYVIARAMTLSRTERI